MTPIIISRIFDPFLMAFVTLSILLNRGPHYVQVLLIMTLLPFLLFFIFWKTKLVSNWDISNRAERPKFLWMLIGIEAIAIIFSRQWNVLPFLCALIGFGIITHKWKISGHMMALGLATGVVIARYGWSWWPVFLSVPLVGWSRVVTKNHTIAQVIAGTMYSWAIVYFFV